jgi:8-oxo-dGTP pyrophosphatase MutT (NUDIX family)
LKQQPNDSEANTWGVPGGKIGKTESAEASSMREVYEETGIDLKGTSLSNSR